MVCVDVVYVVDGGGTVGSVVCACTVVAVGSVVAGWAVNGVIVDDVVDGDGVVVDAFGAVLGPGLGMFGFAG